MIQELIRGFLEEGFMRSLEKDRTYEEKELARKTCRNETVKEI